MERPQDESRGGSAAGAPEEGLATATYERRVFTQVPLGQVEGAVRAAAAELQPAPTIGEELPGGSGEGPSTPPSSPTAAGAPPPRLAVFAPPPAPPPPGGGAPPGSPPPYLRAPGSPAWPAAAAASEAGASVYHTPTAAIVVVPKEARPAAGTDLSPRDLEAAAGLRQPLLAPDERRAGGGEGAGEEPARAGTGLGSTVALLASAVLGVALVVVPRAFTLLGYAGGLVALAAVFGLAYASAAALLAASAARDKWTYSALCRDALGPAGAAAADVAVAAACFGGMVVALLVLADVVVGGGAGGEGLMEGWADDRGLVLGALCVVVVAPLVSSRARLSPRGAAPGAQHESALAVAAAAAVVGIAAALAAAAAAGGKAHRARAWPLPGELGGGALFATFQAAGVLPLLLVLAAPLHASALHPAAAARLRAARGDGARAARETRRAAAAALLLGFAAAAALGLAAPAALGGGRLHADVLQDLAVERMAPLLGGAAAKAAFLGARLAFAVALAESFPLLAGPAVEGAFRLLFCGPLVPSPGYYLARYAAVGGALAGALSLRSIWAPLQLVGATAGAALALVLPGLVAARTARRGAAAAGGYALAAAGAALGLAGLAGAAFVGSR